MNNKISEEKIKKYFEVTKRALDKIKIPEKLGSELKWRDIAEDYRDMAQRYFDDAHYFYKKGDVVLAFGALNYAHAWLDAGARIGIFDVDHDNQLFTVD